MEQTIIRTIKGKEGFFFQKDELIIRELSVDDIEAFMKCLRNLVNVNEEDERNYLTDLISQRDVEKDDKFILLVTSKDGEIIGFLKFNLIPESYYCDTEIRVYLKDQRTIDEEGPNVLKAIRFVHEEYGLFDQIYFMDDENNRVDIEQLIA